MHFVMFCLLSWCFADLLWFVCKLQQLHLNGFEWNTNTWQYCNAAWTAPHDHFHYGSIWCSAWCSISQSNCLVVVAQLLEPTDLTHTREQMELLLNEPSSHPHFITCLISTDSPLKHTVVFKVFMKEIFF